MDTIVINVVEGDRISETGRMKASTTLVTQTHQIKQKQCIQLINLSVENQIERKNGNRLDIIEMAQ